MIINSSKRYFVQSGGYSQHPREGYRYVYRFFIRERIEFISGFFLRDEKVTYICMDFK